MTDREKAIVTAYTGVNMLEGEKFNEFYKYLEEIYGRPVYTHEIPFLEIQEKSKDDFIAMCRSESVPLYDSVTVNLSDLYLCDPDKNTECKKTACYRNGGECIHTVHEKYRRVE